VILLGIASESLERLDLQFDARLPYGAYLSDDVTFPVLQNLCVASRPEFETYDYGTSPGDSHSNS